MYNKDRKKERGENKMKATITNRFRFTTYATIEAEENEVLTEKAIEEKYFFPFGGIIIGMTDKIAHVQWYED